MTADQLKSLYRKRRRNAALFMLLAALAALYLFNFIIYRDPLILVYVAVPAALALPVWRRRPGPPSQPSLEAEDRARELYDAATRAPLAGCSSASF